MTLSGISEAEARQIEKVSLCTGHGGAAVLALGQAGERPDIPSRVSGEVGGVDLRGLLDPVLAKYDD